MAGVLGIVRRYREAFERCRPGGVGRRYEARSRGSETPIAITEEARRGFFSGAYPVSRLGAKIRLTRRMAAHLPRCPRTLCPVPYALNHQRQNCLPVFLNSHRLHLQLPFENKTPQTRLRNGESLIPCPDAVRDIGGNYNACYSACHQ